MLNTQRDYIEFLSYCKNELRGVDTIDCNAFELDFKIDTIKNMDLVVPVIGAFSAGKSSLLNSFLGKNILGVALSPETAIATELHYSIKEYIQAVKENGDTEEFPLDSNSKDTIKSRANEFKFVRFFVDSSMLKSIEPLVLVDMPGFESPLDSHNKAILEYIQRGVYFVVLQSVEDGNITKSTIRELENIHNFDRKFAFFLSKANLKPQSEIQRIKEYVQEQLDDSFDDINICLIDDNGRDSLNAILKELNPDDIVKDLFLPDIKDTALDIRQNINTSIYSLNQTKEKNEEALQELSNSLQTLEKEQSMMIQEAQSRYSDASVKRIVNNVVRALSNNADEMAQAYKARGQSGIDSMINEIIKNSASHDINMAMKDISQDIADTLSRSLENINANMSDMTMDSNWLVSLNQSALALGRGGGRLLSNVAKALIGMGGIAGSLGGALKFALPVLNPILMIAVSLLPNVLLGLFNNGNKEKEELNNIKNAIITQVIPQIKDELQAKIPEIFNEQVQKMIEAICNDFKDKIAQQKQTLELTQKEISEKSFDIQNKIEQYKRILDNITSKADCLI